MRLPPYETRDRPWFGPTQRARTCLRDRERLLHPEEALGALVAAMGKHADQIQRVRFIDFHHRERGGFRFTIAAARRPKKRYPRAPQTYWSQGHHSSALTGLRGFKVEQCEVCGSTQCAAVPMPSFPFAFAHPGSRRCLTGHVRPRHPLAVG